MLRFLVLVETFELLPVYAVYLVMFGLASESKFAQGGVPEWFRKQFMATPLDIFPGAITAQFYLIAVCEALICAGLILSLMKREFLPGRSKKVLRASLFFASLVFVMLSVGLRVTGDFNTAFQVFVYFVVTYGLMKLLTIS